MKGAAMFLPTKDAMSAPQAELSEILPHLELDRALLPGWFARVRAFCERHGGRRRYEDVLSLLERCDAALERES